MLKGRFASVCALAMLCGASAIAGAQRAQAPTAGNGQIQMIIDRGPFKAEVVTLQQTGGDWFASQTDAHASLTFSGDHKGSPVQLALQWDGRDGTHVIDEDHNSDAGGEHVTFFLTMSGEAPFNLSAAPRNEDVVTISVSKLDELDFQAALSGTVTSSAYDETEHHNAVLTVHGMIVLHRARAPARPTTGTYTNCDNVVYDKLVGAQDRSPSECEVKFEADVRQALGGAFGKVMNAFSASPWRVEPEEPHRLAAGVGRGSEKTLFSIDPFRVIARMEPDSPAYQAFRARYEDLTDKLRREVNASLGTMGPAYQALMKLTDEVNGATRVSVVASINQPSGGFVSFSGEHRMLRVPGAAYAIAASRVQAPTGGGGEDSLPSVSYVFLGNWKPAAFEKLGDGGERMRATSTIGAGAPRLSVQNIVIRIECNPTLTDAVLQQIDFPALQRLLPK